MILLGLGIEISNRLGSLETYPMFATICMRRLRSTRRLPEGAAMPAYDSPGSSPLACLLAGVGCRGLLHQSAKRGLANRPIPPPLPLPQRTQGRLRQQCCPVAARAKTTHKNAPRQTSSLPIGEEFSTATNAAGRMLMEKKIPEDFVPRNYVWQQR